MIIGRPRTGWQRVGLAVLLAYGLALKLLVSAAVMPALASAPGVICHTSQGPEAPGDGHDLSCEACCLMRVAAVAAPLIDAAPAFLPMPEGRTQLVSLPKRQADGSPPAEAWSGLHAARGPPVEG